MMKLDFIKIKKATKKIGGRRANPISMKCRKRMISSTFS
jgi:hypothetical protein